MSHERQRNGGTTTEEMFSWIAIINEWLDKSNTSVASDDVMRVLKVMEEAGEAAGAYIGMTGQNPRKGVTHTRDEMMQELADVALTALCAIQHFTQDARRTEEIFAQKVNGVMLRAGLVIDELPATS